MNLAENMHININRERKFQIELGFSRFYLSRTNDDDAAAADRIDQYLWDID